MDVGRRAQVRARRSLAMGQGADDVCESSDDDDHKALGARSGVERSESQGRKHKGKKGGGAPGHNLWDTLYAPPKPTRARPRLDGG